MFFRNRLLVQTIACFFLLEIIGSIVAPSVSWAVMGPSQPEYTSYEAPGGTDMVNLSTGNFTYSIPILDIPGPERSFSLPLSYHAGIQLEQEASWVGLGWTLNAGAINRGVNGYPDDANNEPVKLTFKKSLDHSDSYWVMLGIWRGSYDSNTGYGGSVDLLGIVGLNWDKNGIEGGDIIGMGYQANKGMTADPVRMVMAVVTIASLGTASELSLAVNIGLQMEENAASLIIMGLACGRQGGAKGFNNKPTQWTYSDLGDTWSAAFYDNLNLEYSYGSLYFGKMAQANGQYGTGPLVASSNMALESPTFYADRVMDDNGTRLTETAADIYQAGTLDGGDYYETSIHPISTAHDYYNVMGEGATGDIRPYRLDVGSVAYPKFGRDEANKHSKYNAVPFLDYKVPFRYESALSNTYEYQAPASTINITGFSIDSGNNVTTVRTYLRNSEPRLNDPGARIEAARKGLNWTASNPQLVQGKHTVWYTNAEIAQMAGNGPFAGYNNDFLNYATPVSTDIPVIGNTIHIPDIFRGSLPHDGIGAFAVTIEDGTTYHYSLPVYNYKTYSESNERQLQGITVGDGLGQATKCEGFAFTGTASQQNLPGQNPYSAAAAGYATTWLLTAITSPDYIDRNHSGTADAADWGGWVSFNYGKLSSQYEWRQPYIGTSYSDDKDPFEYESFVEGYKETYYLNSISTRTHTALFIKSVREDGRGSFTGVQQVNSVLSIDDAWPASSLRLDEIVLLDNATLTKLQTPNGIHSPTDTSPVPALSNNTSNNAPSCGANGTGAPSCTAGDDMGQVLDAQDLDVDSHIRRFVEANAIKRIHFNYSYELCRGTPSSFAYDYNNPGNHPPLDVIHMSVNRGGKLTLKSISFFGPTVGQQPTKLIPDFTFGYDVDGIDVRVTNPNYGPDKWDGFGMYKSGGLPAVTGHLPEAWSSPPWTLTRITSPLGGVTSIKYERDEYAHVSEYGTHKIPMTVSYPNGVRITNPNTNIVAILSVPLSSTGSVDLAHIWPNGTVISLAGAVHFAMCSFSGNFTPGLGVPVDAKFSGEFAHVQQITSSNGNWQVTLELDFQPHPDYSGIPRDLQCPTPIIVGMDLESTIPWNTPGGDVRVAAVTTTDPVSQQTSQVRYQYQLDGPTAYNSSGVLAKEPNFVNRLTHKFYSYFDYPTTSVLYSQVTVLHGLFRNNDATDFDQREVYNFNTPVSSMVTEQNSTNYWGGLDFRATTGQSASSNNLLAEFKNDITINTGLIGRPKSVQVFNGQGQAEISTSFTYSPDVPNADNIPRQGYFTEGVLNNELLDLHGYRVNRTTKHYIPMVLAGSQSTKNGVTIENHNVLYDFYTGQLLESAFQNSRGEVYHSRSVPAYTLYPDMGAKGDDPTNRHMLTQQAANYTFKEKRGVTYDPAHFLQTADIFSAGVQTWTDNWTNYRGVNGTGDYADLPGPYQPIWRQAASYTWQSSQVNPNGSAANFADFTWQGVPNAHWVKTNEATRYDHYSHALESRDVNGAYSAIKTGYGQSQEIATASNTLYTELAYSGAEDIAPDAPGYYGGEVAIGGQRTDDIAHTGKYSNMVSPGTDGFRYRAIIGKDIFVGKAYRASVWMKGDEGQSYGQLFADLNGATMTSAAITPTTKKAGDWYRLDLEIVVPPTTASGQSTIGLPLVFGCRASTGGVSLKFDDFRVCPSAASMSSKVYDASTNRLVATLDNENLYTRYEYNTAGRLSRVYKESFDKNNDYFESGHLIKEYEYNYAHWLDPTWVTTGYTCEIVDGTASGYQSRIEEDINSALPHTQRNIRNNLSTDCPLLHCPTSTGVDVGQWRRVPGTNSCEQAVGDFTTYGRPIECVDDQNGTLPPTRHRTVYCWHWPSDASIVFYTNGPWQGGTCANPQ